MRPAIQRGGMQLESCSMDTATGTPLKRRGKNGTGSWRSAPREMNLLILGAGGHGEIIRELAQSLGVFRKIGFLDDDLKNPLAMGRCDDCLRYLEEYPIAIPSVGDQKLRMQWLAMLARNGFVLPILVHPTATVSPSAAVGYGTVIEARATVSPGVRIGNGCIIASGATIDRNVKIPDGTLVGCGRVITAADFE